MPATFFICKSNELSKYIPSPAAPLRRGGYSIIFTGSEGGIISLNKKDISFRPQTFIFVSPTCFLGIPENQPDIDFLHFSNEFYIRSHHDRAFLQDSPLFPEFSYTDMEIPTQALSYVRSIISLQYNAFENIDKPLYTDLVHNLLEQALIYTSINRVSANLREREFFDDPDKIIVNLFKELMGAYIQKTRTVKFYADKLNVTTRRLSKATHEVVGKTPKNFIIDYAIDQLKWQLAYSEQSIKEIGLNYGFLDDNNFSAFFSKEVGLTPKQYRKRRRQKSDICDSKT